MSLTVYGLKNCDTCRKALKELEAAGKAHTFFDIRQDGLTHQHVSGWVAAHGVDAVLNKRSTTWRNLPDELKEVAETEHGAIDLLTQHSTLIKRPVIELEGKSFIGWTKDTKSQLGVV